MTSIGKLKDRARKHEQKEDWKAAIDAYRKILDAEKAQELELELGLYNRVGDLYLRIGETDNAVKFYEKAADKYAESGFFNNAIALCNKVLRHRPDRPDIYLKLSRFCHGQGFDVEARRWILGYAERQVKRGKVDEAIAGLTEFADASRDPDVRELLAQHLASHGREQDAVEQLRHAHGDWQARGDARAAERAAEQARALDPTVQLDAAAPDTMRAPSGLPGLDDPLQPTPPPEPAEPAEPAELAEFAEGPQAGEADEAGPPAGPAAMEGLETTIDRTARAPDVDVVSAEDEEEEEEEEEAAAAEEVEQAETLDALSGIERFHPEEDEAPEAGAGVEPAPGASVVPEVDDDEPEALPFLDGGFGDEEAAPETPPLVEEPAEVEEVEAIEEVDEVEEVEEVAAEIELEEFAPVEEPAEPAVVEEVEEVAAVEEVEEVAAVEEVEEVEEAPEEEEEEELILDLSGGMSMVDEALEAPPVIDVAGDDLIDLDTVSFDLGEPDPSHMPRAEDLNVDVVIERSKELVSRGLPKEAARELRLLSGADASPEVFREALAVTNEIIRQDPDDIDVLQRRVDFATRVGDRDVLVETCLDLADALAAAGAETKARAMYQRVLSLEPGNEDAREALGEPPASESEPLDLEAILREMPSSAEDPGSASGSGGGPGDAGGAGAAEAEWDEGLATMLSQFRARVDGQTGVEDAGDHYDLGIAFKEMGLVDEAIAEFQTALKGGEERLKVYEELGHCFILKGQPNVAIKVLKRALQAPKQEEAELLGVYYFMGQCYEELGERNEARAAYEKVLAIDPDFADVPGRVGRL